RPSVPPIFSCAIPRPPASTLLPYPTLFRSQPHRHRPPARRAGGGRPHRRPGGWSRVTGRQLGGRYELGRQIGDGGMAVVYEAVDRLLDRRVAVKILRPEVANDDQFLRRFSREARAAARLWERKS